MPHSKYSIRSMPAAFLLLGLLDGCGGGGDGGSSSSSVANASPGGIWRGTDSLTNLTILGLVTESGQFHFIRSDGTQFFGTMTVSGSSVSGSLQGVTEYGLYFADGSHTGTGTYAGTVAARSSLNGSVAFRTSVGNNSTATVNLTFDNQYNTPSSLARIAGNFRDTATNAVINVSGGTIFEQDAVTGCVVNGTVSIINASYNAYGIQYQFASCRGAYSYLNGTTATGIGMIDTSTNPEQAVIGVVNYAAGYSLVGSFPRI